MSGARSNKWKLVASTLIALLTTGTAAPYASAQTPEATPPALTPPRVTKFVEAKRPEGTPTEGATVDLELTIAADGKLTDAKVVTSASAELDAAALDAVRQFTFEPARRGDRPVPARIRYRYTFNPEAPPVPPVGTGDAATPVPDAAPTPSATAPRAGRLEGRILARTGDKPVAAATVTLLSAEGASVGTTLAAEDGAFAFPDVAPGSYRVRIEAEGFAAVEATEAVTSGEATAITYRLEAAKKKADTEYEFGATASIAAPPREVVKRTLAPQELVRAAGTRGDPLRVIELLPGVARPPGLAGFIIIRGASPFDSQAFFEGGPVDRIYHFGGLTSFVNPRLLERIDLYPGNFSARFGRKMGGIIDVGIRDPKTDGYHGMVDVNLIDASFIVEGPVGKRGAFALAGKRSYIDFWFENVVPADAIGVTAAPVYSDYQAIYTYRPESGGKVRTMFFGSGDEFRLNLKKPADGDPSIRGNIGQGTSFRRLQTTWQRSLGAHVEQEITAGVGTIEQDVSIGTLGFSFTGFDQFLRAEWRAQLGSRVKLVGGFDGYAVELDVSYVGPTFQSSEGNPRYFSGPLTGLPTATYKGPYNSYRPAGYLEALIQAGERLTLVPGVRVDYYSEIEKGSVNPRLTARFKLAPQTTLKGGVGLFSQPPLYGESVPPVGNPNLGLSQAQHYGLGVEQAFGRVGSVSLESFYKRLSDLEINGVGPDGNPLLVNGGKGRIYGLELLAKLNPTGRAFGFVSYTLSRSERNDYGLAWRLFDFDQTHILTTMGGTRFGRGWDVGATFRLVSGNPRTPIVGSVYDANADFYNPVYGAVNSARDPLFHQASVRIEKGWQFKAWRLASYLDVQNFYNHRSQEGLQYSYNYARSKPVQGLPILPSLGLRGEF
jgi:TonB family protein